MLLITREISQLSFGKLMNVYEEGNAEKAALSYRTMDRNAAILLAEQDFYAYLAECFFKTDGAFYAVWQEKTEYISALRMEPYRDGLLLEGLETTPAYRRMGYAVKLLKAVLADVSAPVYSHVNKENMPSLRAHEACGFVRIADSAEMIDGTVSEEHCTLYRK